MGAGFALIILLAGCSSDEDAKITGSPVAESGSAVIEPGDPSSSGGDSSEGSAARVSGGQTKVRIDSDARTLDVPVMCNDAGDRFVIIAEKQVVSGPTSTFEGDGAANITLSPDQGHVIDASVIVGEADVLYDETQGFTDAAVTKSGNTFT